VAEPAASHRYSRAPLLLCISQLTYSPGVLKRALRWRQAKRFQFGLLIRRAFHSRTQLQGNVPSVSHSSSSTSIYQFFFVYSYSRATYIDHGGVHFTQFSCPPSARWRHVAITPLPSAQACPKKMCSAPRRLQMKVQMKWITLSCGRHEVRRGEEQWWFLPTQLLSPRSLLLQPPAPPTQTPRSQHPPPRPAPAFPHP